VNAVLQPDQFSVNEAWIAFQLNRTPIHTEADGDFKCLALMDAASCFILSSTLVPARNAEPSKAQVRQLLKQASAHKKALPERLLLPVGKFTANLPAEAERQGIAVVRVPERQLLVFVGEAQDGFEAQFGGGRGQ
jgi:hypothetical protein